ncbi:hypothetical protein BW897_11025 [Bacillus cereus]|uniref:DUF4365 domain-containing protein n=1 Tax=Bacillus cereus TaxID=1396 RepID=A0A1S9TRT3_BACCE|nr:hypothetical protein [Bacillus cereus]OOR12637.1 hypothetical protein BW897_11025 [Bacillus cereus]
MLQYNLNELDNLQKGRQGEEFAKLKFKYYGFDICASKVFGKGLGFKIKKDDNYYDIKVRTLTKLDYVYFKKNTISLRDDLFVVWVLFNGGKEPNLYLIPSTVWETPNDVFVSRDYEGLKTNPEWGINISGKNLPEMEQYRFEKTISMML